MFWAVGEALAGSKLEVACKGTKATAMWSSGSAEQEFVKGLKTGQATFNHPWSVGHQSRKPEKVVNSKVLSNFAWRNVMSVMRSALPFS